MNLNTAIDQIIAYAMDYLMLDESDAIYARNRILSIINLDEYRPSKEEIGDIDDVSVPLNALLDGAATARMIKAGDKEKVAQRIMRVLVLCPSEITEIYKRTAATNKAKADAWLSEYITLSRLDKGCADDAFAFERGDTGVSFIPQIERTEPEYIGVYGAINALIQYAENNLLLEDADRGFILQDILDTLEIKSYNSSSADEEITELERPDAIIEILGAELMNAKLVNESELNATIDLLLGIVSIKPSRINKIFSDLTRANSKKAMDWLYDYCIKNNYVKRSLLDSNIRFKAGYTKGGLEITINKAKPEYADAKKAASGNATPGGYPKCTICPENEGFVPLSRSTLRTVELALGGEKWFWQYSPYGYFYKHGIAVNSDHTPMTVNADTVMKLLDFVDIYPNMFIGCNAALTGVGGSVLAHDHFQGGEEMLPAQRAGVAIPLAFTKYPLAQVGVLDWYNTVIRITSQSRQVIREISNEIIEGWRSYTNKELGLIANDADGSHNGTSPSARKIDNGRYSVDITLRNNCTSPEFPLGIFHAHPEFHAIKKESIGLIESQGLFILPGRLEAQIEQLRECLAGQEKLPKELKEFEFVYNEIIKENGKEYTKVEALIAIKAELGSVCERILQNTAVFKTANETADFLVSLGSFEKQS